MAGNFLKYGAAESSFGAMNAGNIPVDSHQLIALCAPRPVFISYGIPEKGDALWLDQQGSFMATVAAGAAYRLLGAKDLGVTTDEDATCQYWPTGWRALLAAACRRPYRRAELEALYSVGIEEINKIILHSSTSPAKLRMMTAPEEKTAYTLLESRLKAILPEAYKDRYEDVQPVSMGSAGLKFGSDGKVAWDEIWGSFCDLAMAGGPPHKGTLLEPGSAAEISKQPEQYQWVTEEICRGIRLATVLPARHSEDVGWVDVECSDEGMSGWLMRAIVMENVSARYKGRVLQLPAGPTYRLEKEIKNVITSIAKTSHYWIDHMWSQQQQEIGRLFEEMSRELPLQEPARPDDPGFQQDSQQALSQQMADSIEKVTGLRKSSHSYLHWVGVECPDVRSAVWMMRALVASNIVSRREGTALFLPVNAVTNPDGKLVLSKIFEIYGFAKAREVLTSPVTT